MSLNETLNENFNAIAFLEMAKDSATGRVYYEDYIALFTN